MKHSFSLAVSSGTRNTLPAEARTALGFHALTVPGRQTTPSAPNASAERRIVPRLPGSCRPASTSTSGAAFSLAVEQVRPGPFRRLDQRGNGLRRLRCQRGVQQRLRQQQHFCFRGPAQALQAAAQLPAPQRRSECAARRAAPPRSGSALRCQPALALRGSLASGWASARRSCFKRAFCLLCTMRTGIGRNLVVLSRFYAVRGRATAHRALPLELARHGGAVIVSVFVASVTRELR